MRLRRPRGRYNAVGRVSAITIATPVEPGRLHALRQTLDSLTSDASPFSHIDQIHVARWVVVESFGGRGRRGPPEDLGGPYLFFLCTFDGTADQLLRDIATTIGRDADAVWEACVDYPGSVDEKAFVGYLRGHEIDTSHFVAGYGDASVAQVRQSLRDRSALIDLATVALTLDSDELRRRFIATFVTR